MSSVDWNDKQQVLKAFQQEALSLLYASEELQNDKEVVFAAVSKDGKSLEFASNELKNDKEIVLAAINENPFSIQYASDELKNDKKIVLVAVNKDGYSLTFVSSELQNDYDLLNLLKKYHISRTIDFYTEEYKTWYYERMKVLDILSEQNLLEKNIPNNSVKTKVRKF